MVKIIPTYECDLESRKKPDDVAIALRWVTEEPKMFNLYSWHREFTGLIESRHFRISQNIDFRNLYQPFIEGSVEEIESGSLIHIKMEMHPFISIFTIFLMGSILLNFLSGLIRAIFDGVFGGFLFLLIPLTLIAIGELLIRSAFYSSAKKSIERLKDLLFCYDLK